MPKQAPPPPSTKNAATTRATGWPWAPGTWAQGFVSHRWNRRDGVGFAALGRQATNSADRGGDDAIEHTGFCGPASDGT